MGQVVRTVSKVDVPDRSVLLSVGLYYVFTLLVILCLYWSFIGRYLRDVLELLFSVKKSNLIVIRFWFGKISRLSETLLRWLLFLFYPNRYKFRQLLGDGAAFRIVRLRYSLTLIYRVKLLLGLAVNGSGQNATLAGLVNLWEDFRIQNQHPGLFSRVFKLWVRVNETQGLFILNHVRVGSIFLCFLDQLRHVFR